MNGIYIGTTLFSKVRFAQLFKKAHLILLFLALISQGLVGMNEASAEQIHDAESLMQSVAEVQIHGFDVQPSKAVRALLMQCDQICKTSEYGFAQVQQLEECMNALKEQLTVEAGSQANTQNVSQDFLNAVYRAAEYVRLEGDRLYIHPLSQVSFVGKSPTRISEEQLQKLYAIEGAAASTNQKSNHGDQNALENPSDGNCDDGICVR